MRVSVDVPFNAWGARFIVDGWRRADDDAFGLRYFLDGDAGTMVVPLDVVAHQSYGIEIRSRAGRAGPHANPVVLSVDVNGHDLGRFTLMLGADPTTAQFTVRTDGRSRPWRKGYSRVTFRRVLSAGPEPRSAPVPAVAVYLVRFGPDLRAVGKH